MRKRFLAVSITAWLGVGFACSAAPRIDSFTPEHHSWPRIMEEVIEPTWLYTLLPATEKPAEEIDLVDISARAELAARYLAYAMELDPHDDIEGFGEAATAATDWLLHVSTVAGDGDRAGVQDLISGGEAAYCDRCHDLLP